MKKQNEIENMKKSLQTFDDDIDREKGIIIEITDFSKSLTAIPICSIFLITMQI